MRRSHPFAAQVVRDPAPAGDHKCPILILHGDDDPFVPELDATIEAFKAKNISWEKHVFSGARHGFTNPGQALNDQDAFDYDERAANAAWILAEQHLVATLS